MEQYKYLGCCHRLLFDTKTDFCVFEPLHKKMDTFGYSGKESLSIGCGMIARGEVALAVYATAAGCKKIAEMTVIDPHRTAVHEMAPFVPFEAEGYRIVPLKADHDPATDPVFFIIEKGEKTLLYAHDTGWFPEETWDFLAHYDRKFDCVSLDCTCMLVEFREGHMGLAACRDTYARLTEMGLCDATTVACVNHFSHNGNATHEQFATEAANCGFLTAFDGMTVEF